MPSFSLKHNRESVQALVKEGVWTGLLDAAHASSCVKLRAHALTCLPNLKP